MKNEIQILFEDTDILVINKPAGVVVNRVTSNHEVSIQDWVDEHYGLTSIEFPEKGSILDIFKKRGGIAHRLDKETSGALLIAKNPTSLESLMRQFKARRIKKEYLALVHGILIPHDGAIRLPIARSKKSRERQEVRYDGKSAETTWLVEREFVKMTLVRLYPLTGRMHQIRVHMAHLGHPIFADSKYLNKGQWEIDRESLDHHFLHAEVIEFTNLRGEKHRVESDLGLEEKKLLGMLI